MQRDLTICKMSHLVRPWDDVFCILECKLLCVTAKISDSQDIASSIPSRSMHSEIVKTLELEKYNKLHLTLNSAVFGAEIVKTQTG